MRGTWEKVAKVMLLCSPPAAVKPEVKMLIPASDDDTVSISYYNLQSILTINLLMQVSLSTLSGQYRLIITMFIVVIYT